MLSQVPGVREGDFYWSNESFCLSGPFFPCFFLVPGSFSGKCLIFPPPPRPASVPIILPVLDFGRLRATIRASVYGAGHMARNAK